MRHPQTCAMHTRVPTASYFTSSRNSYPWILHLFHYRLVDSDNVILVNHETNDIDNDNLMLLLIVANPTTSIRISIDPDP
eukprot:COSAG02_NODE_1975_length_10211_cov_8.737737_2_plen_80_part_00